MISLNLQSFSSLVSITVSIFFFVRLVQKHRSQAEKVLTTKELEMHDLKNTVAAEIEALPSSSVNELQREIMVSLLEFFFIVTVFAFSSCIFSSFLINMPERPRRDR